MLIDNCPFCQGNFVPSLRFRIFCSEFCFESFITLTINSEQRRHRGAYDPTAEAVSDGGRPAAASCVSIKGCMPNE